MELGAGSATKTTLLLNAMDSCELLERYVPIDVSESAMQGTAAMLANEYPDLEVHCLVGDFEQHLEQIPASENPRTFAILGGTVGNFTPTERVELLSRVRNLLTPEDHLLLGTDLVKDPAVIEAAYNDSAGVTAEFNRNMLHVINRELGANFTPERFDHRAFFDSDNEWIEMRLQAAEDCTVTIEQLGMEVEFAADEELRTEISAKFTQERLTNEYAEAGLRLKQWYSDENSLFALSLAEPV